MKNKFLFAFAALLLCSCPGRDSMVSGPKHDASVVVAGGTDVGSATSSFGTADGAAWFVGMKRAPRVCFEVAPDFGVTPDVAKAAIKKAFETWHDYIATRKINRSLPRELPLNTIEPEISTPCPKEKEWDLQVFFGVENDLVARYKGQFHNPTAFVQPISFDSELPWGTGIIWLAKENMVEPQFRLPNWSSPGTLLGVLLHEIGHTYGNDHIAGTIMAGDLNRILGSRNEETITRIDHCRELAPCMDCTYVQPLDKTKTHKGKWTALQLEYEREREQARLPIIEKLIGRQLADNPRLIVKRLGTIWSLVAVKDSIGAKFFFIWPLPANETKFATGLYAFRVVRRHSVWRTPDESVIQYSPSRPRDAGEIEHIPFSEISEPENPTVMFTIEQNMASCTAFQYDGRAPLLVSVEQGHRQNRLGCFAADRTPDSCF